MLMTPRGLKKVAGLVLVQRNLGLSGVVVSQDFTPTFEGRLPEGDVLGKVTKVEKQHSPGRGFTFSSLTSVSILYELDVHDK